MILLILLIEICKYSHLLLLLLGGSKNFISNFRTVTDSSILVQYKYYYNIFGKCFNGKIKRFLFCKKKEENRLT